MKDLRPGKGFYADATSESVEFLRDALDDVVGVFQAEYGPDDVSGDSWIDEGNGKDLLAELLEIPGWEAESDKFGKKAFRLIEWGEGAYRVTLILNNRGELKIDIRHWFVAD